MFKNSIVVVVALLLSVNICVANEAKINLTQKEVVLTVAIFLFILFLAFKLFSLNRQLVTSHKKIKQLSIKDDLTGLFNRRFLEATMEKELDRIKRYGHELSVIKLDIDNFKTVNDKYGQQVGDEVLIGLASMIKNKTRKTDTTSRWGGEEFLILCPETDKEGAILLAEFLKVRISQLVFTSGLKISASFGVSTSGEKDTTDSLISKADKALYKAKNGGRNRVIAI